MKKFTQKLKVRSYELDAQGHVNYAVYLSYLEYARVTTMEQLGIPFQDYLKEGKHVVIAEVRLKYLYPATLGDELEITMEGIRTRRTSLTFKQEIFNTKTGKKILDAEVVAVHVNREGKPVPLYEDFREAFL
ncbi:MAG: YbgC/FadM family acyl-CoA thioesterase [Candidatus Aminicenantes bacterium]|nr:YbgC/FadM family acyl-CoA thioesterase [Candidatus Aminicenantes bacterium]